MGWTRMECYVVEFDDSRYLALTFFDGTRASRVESVRAATAWRTRIAATLAAHRLLDPDVDWRVVELRKEGS